MANKTLNVRIQNKYDTEANWASKNPVLLKGEAAYSSDKNGLYKIGNGTSKWSDLKYNSANTLVNHTSGEGFEFGYANSKTITIPKTTAVTTYYIQIAQKANFRFKNYYVKTSGNNTQYSFQAEISANAYMEPHVTLNTQKYNDSEVKSILICKNSTNSYHHDIYLVVNSSTSVAKTIYIWSDNTILDTVSTTVPTTATELNVNITNDSYIYTSKKIQANITGSAGSVAWGNITGKPSTYYTHPSYTARSSGLYKVTVDATGHVSGATAVSKADITALGIPGTDTNTWRGVQNNLTSTATDQSLSAAQGKILNELTFQKKKAIDATVDWDTLKEFGCYKIQMASWGDAATKHSPNAYGNVYQFGLLLVFRGYDADSENRTVQIYIPHKADADVSSVVLMRMLNGTGWQSWHPLARGTSWGDIINKPTTFTPSSHTHDDRYYTESEINSKLAGYLPLSGGAMTGNISYKGTKATYEMIKFIDNKNDIYGNGIAIGGGGLTIIGGGESSDAVKSLYPNDGAQERMIVANDGAIEFYTGCQDGISKAAHTTIDNTGLFSGTAAKANAVPWSGITGKPSTFPPSSHSHSYLPLSGGSMTGNIKFNTKWNNYIGEGNTDNSSAVGGDLNNLVIASWWGVSFTTPCANQTYTNKTAVGIDCRNGIVKAAEFRGTFTGNASTATALTTSAGSATQPVYFSGGKPVATTYTLNASVPAGAKFTDTNTWRPVENVLTSTSTSNSLSAAQGKVLKDSLDQTNAKVNNIQIGGRNLARGTSSDWSGWFTPRANKSNDCEVIYFIYPGTAKSKGDTFTVSFDIDVKKFTQSSGGTFQIYLQGAVDEAWTAGNPFTSYNFRSKALNGDYTEHVTYTCQLGNDAQASATKFEFAYRCDYSNGTGKFRIRNLKVERGNKATDWSPAPEDYLPLTGGQVSGVITASTSAGADIGFKAINTTTGKAISFIVGSGQQNRGLYDSNGNQWMVYSDANNVVRLNGNASTATKLATARSINGTSFDGSGNITTAKWGTARTFSLTGSVTGSASIDGSGNVSLATTTNHTHGQYYDSGVSRTANTVLAAPNGANGGATFRALVAADIPTLTKSKISDFPTSLAPTSGSNNYVRVYNSKDIGNSSTVTFNDLAKQHFAMGMINGATDNPYGAAKWAHGISMAWSNGANTSWISQIALGVQEGTGMWYRARQGTIVGADWTRVLDSSNYTSYAATKGHAHSTLTLPRVTKDANGTAQKNVFKVEEFSSGTTYNLPSNHWYYIMTNQGSDTNYAAQLALGMTTTNIAYRVRNGSATTWGGWNTILTSANYTNYAATKGHTHDLSTMINTLTTGTSAPMDSDYYVTQYAGGGTTTTSYHRRPHSALWTYIKSKADAVYQPKGSYAAANHTHSYLPLSGGTMNGNLFLANGSTYYINNSAHANFRALGTAENTYIPFPQSGGFRTTASVNTGYLKITLPQSWSSTMISFKVKIYEYRSDTSCEYTISGYNYTAESAWKNCTACSIGKNDTKTVSNLAVRFGHDGSKCAVYIGEADTKWNYVQVQVCDIVVGYTNYEYSKWASGWSVGFTTTLGTITQTKTNPNVSRISTVYDISTGTGTTFAYSKSGMNYADYTWLAGWNGYELRAVAKSQFATAGHTHNYAGSSSAGGAATSANKLNTNAGSATQPVYFSNGIPVACTYTLGKSVPADAKFTDTNTWRGIQDNLTSSSTSDSLSANQGRILKGLVDGKAASGHTHNYAGSSSAGGSANSAVKLATARTVSGGTDITISYSYDGSANSTANIGFYACSASVGNTNNYPFHRFAKLDTITGSYIDKSSTFYISQDYNGGGFGIVRIVLRTNNSSSVSSAEVRWLVRSGLASDSVQVGIYNVNGKTYADAFFKTQGTYASTIFRAIANGARGTIARTWTLINSAEGNNTTASDAKTSTECYVNIATAATKIHNQAYSTTVSGSDSGTASYANSAGTSSNVKDSNDGGATTFAYSKSGLDYGNYTWLAAWNNKELRAVNKSQFATAGHTHKYAGSGSAGGSATSAVKLDTSTAGSATQPVYFTGGKPVACTYTLGKSVPSNAVFTDTNNKMTQTAITSKDYTNWRTVLWGASNSGTEGFTPTTVTDGAFTDTNLSYQPSTGTLRAKVFKGALSGNADTATTANTAKAIVNKSTIGNNTTSQTALNFMSGDSSSTITGDYAKCMFVNDFTNYRFGLKSEVSITNTVNSTATYSERWLWYVDAKSTEMRIRNSVEDISSLSDALLPPVLSDSGTGRVYSLGANTSSKIMKFRIYNNGANQSATTVNVTYSTSDIRLKDNVKDTDIKDALSVINKMKIRQFDWKDDNKHQKIGFVADELEELDDKLVVGGGWEDEDHTQMNVKGVDTFYMMGYVVKGMQELSEQIKALTKENKELRKQIEGLKGEG